MNRESIDIEALLVRAYREKAVDRFGHSDERAERAWRLVLLSRPSTGGGFTGGERVQSTGYAQTLAARQARGWAMLEGWRSGGLDLLHDAVLALPTFYLEPLGGLDFVVWDAQTALRLGHRIAVAHGVATVERVRRRGGSDPKRAGELRPAGPPRRVRAIEATTLMICHGRAADRPFVPDVVVTGRRPVLRGARKQAAAYEPVHETPLAQVVEARAVYATWHACLGLLRDACAGVPGLAVTGPAAPAAPWEGHAPGSFGTGRRDGKNDVVSEG